MLDFHSWRLANKLSYDPLKTGSISLDQLKAVARARGTRIHFGDILIIRSGYITTFNDLSDGEAKMYASVMPPTLSGVEQSEEMLQVSCDFHLPLKTICSLAQCEGSHAEVHSRPSASSRSHDQDASSESNTSVYGRILLRLQAINQASNVGVRRIHSPETLEREANLLNVELPKRNGTCTRSCLPVEAARLESSSIWKNYPNIAERPIVGRFSLQVRSAMYPVALQGKGNDPFCRFQLN